MFVEESRLLDLEGMRNFRRLFDRLTVYDESAGWIALPDAAYFFNDEMLPATYPEERFLQQSDEHMATGRIGVAPPADRAALNMEV